MNCAESEDSICEPGSPPNKKCRVCEGTGSIVKVKFRGRYRTRVEIAKWFRASPEWAGAKVEKDAKGALILKKGRAELRLFEVLQPVEVQRG